MYKKRGQITIFVIIAIVIVVGILAYFLLRDRISIVQAPASLKPIEEYFLSCIQDETDVAVDMLGTKGGYIYLPDFVPGSGYMPTSNYLNFLGSNVPYWYYVSGNNIIREQVPSKAEMERQLERYLNENLDCDFSEFRGRGFDVSMGEIKTDVKISDISVDVAVDADLDVSFADESYRFTSHEQKVNTKLGKFYDEAKKIYNYEKTESFLENYAVDILRLYAPVDGAELSCSPKVWLKNEVDKELKNALEGNMQAIRFKAEKGTDYFVQSLNIDDDVRILYDKSWPTRIEVYDANNGVMMAEPVGNQPGLGILGFCYVTYHFVYDVVYPSLIQIYDGNELFQFPVAVIIDDNVARKALPVNAVLDSEPELCKYPNKEITVYTYNTNLNPVEADVSFECLGQRCDIGSTKIEGGDAVLNAKFPQCLNGFVSVNAEGYAGKRHMFSSNSERETNIILDKLYDLDLELKVNGEITNDMGIITFVSEDNVQTVLWPEQKIVSLSEGSYNISVYVYRDSKITIPGIKDKVCNEVPSSGLLGIFGGTTEKCFDVDIPAQELTNVVSGGGKGSDYFIESQLENGKIIVSVFSITPPSSVEQLQDTYNILEVKPVYVDFE